MEHVAVDGNAKIVKHLTFPPTTAGKVNMIFTDLAVMEVTPKGLLLKEIAPVLLSKTCNLLPSRNSLSALI